LPGIVNRTQEIDGTKLWAYVWRQWSPPMMDEMTIRVAIRATARISFVLFLGAFLGNALYRLLPAAFTGWLNANKDGFTLGFAGSHTVHLAFILTLLVAIGREHVLKGWIMVVAFPAGFLFIYALAAGVLFRHLTFWSSRFEALAHYYLMILLAVSFTLHAITRPVFYTPFVLVAVTAIGMRIAVAIRSRKDHVFGASA
jgi:sulfoxide reductase heme-binding subunit YedZ